MSGNSPDLNHEKDAKSLFEAAINPHLEPLQRADAADALDGLGYQPPDLYLFIPVEVAGKTVHIGKYPVTNRQYQRFLQAGDHRDEDLWLDFPYFDQFGQPTNEGWRGSRQNWLQGALEGKQGIPLEPRYWHDPIFGIRRASAPVVGVTWYEANAYGRWLLKHWVELEEGKADPGLKPGLVRLPLEGEWVAAAGGLEPEKRCPWDALGQATVDPQEIVRRANVQEAEIGRTTPVWMYPDSASPWGVCDLSGNVWEWQANYGDEDKDILALRGGAWNYDSNYARVAGRVGGYAESWWRHYGFRLVVVPGG